MKCVLLVFVALLSIGSGAKILNIFYLPSYSHYSLGHTLSEALANKGHDVTYVHTHANPKTDTKYRSIQLLGWEEKLAAASGEDAPADGMFGMPGFIMAVMLFEIGIISSELVLGHEDFKQLYNEKFDVVITETFMADALKGLCFHYNAPCIGFSSLGASHLSNYAVGNPSNPSYSSNILLPYNSQMTFLQRAETLLFQVGVNLLHHGWYMGKQDQILHKYFPEAPSIHEVIGTTALVLLNSHPSITQPLPLVPSMIEIGGFHITPPKKLPKDLQKILDEAKEGVIYFSLGSAVKSTMLNAEKRSAILKAFGRLKVKVLWKFEDVVMEGKPDNVIISKWYPQQSILAHPNVKLFITHGGLLSTTEACDHGVPLIGIPLFADQLVNMAETELKGVGIKLSYHDLNEHDLYQAIQKILSDKTYKENAMKRSAQLHDRPMKPLDTATYWIEYVIRHKGADHLRIAALDLTWYQYLLLDVIAAISVIVLLPIILLIIVVKKVCAKCKSTKTTSIKKKKN